MFSTLLVSMVSHVSAQQTVLTGTGAAQAKRVITINNKRYQIDSCVSSGTWKASVPLKECQFILIGGGGGAGYDGSNTGGGGGGGGQVALFSFDRFEDNTSTWNVSIGAAGAVATGSSIATNGGVTSLTRSTGTRKLSANGGGYGTDATNGGGAKGGDGGASGGLKQVWLTTSDTNLQYRGPKTTWDQTVFKSSSYGAVTTAAGVGPGSGGSSASAIGTASTSSSNIGGAGAAGYNLNDTFRVDANWTRVAPGGGGGKGTGSGATYGTRGSGAIGAGGTAGSSSATPGILLIRYLDETDGAVSASSTSSSPTTITTLTTGQGLRIGGSKHGKISKSNFTSITLGSLDMVSQSSLTIDGTDLTIDGDVYLGSSGSNGSSVKVTNGGKLTIKGKLVYQTNSYIHIDSGTVSVQGSISYGSGTRFRGSQAANLEIKNGQTTHLWMDSSNTDGNVLKTLSVNGSSIVNLKNVLQMRGGATPGIVYISDENPNTNCTLKTNGFIRLLSTTANKTASIGNVPSGSKVISANSDQISIFIPGRGSNNANGSSVPSKNGSGFVESSRGWRLFGNPCDTGIYVSQYTGGSNEIDITGGTSANGFTANSTGNSSAKYYNESSNAWTDFSAINGNTSGGTLAGGWISSTGGFVALVRGKKGEGLTSTSYSPSNATITLNGKFLTDDKTVSWTLGSSATNTTGWKVISNPYPNSISLSNLLLTNVDNGIYYYNPKRKTWATWNFNKSSRSGQNTNGGNAFIPVGGAFIVHTTNNATTGSVEFVRSKVIRTAYDSLPEGGIFDIQMGTTPNPNELRISLGKYNDSSNLYTGDECVAGIGLFTDATAQFDNQYDAYDFGADIADVGIYNPTDNFNMSINNYSAIPDSISLSVKGHKPDVYILGFSDLPTALTSNYNVVLKDNFTGTRTFISSGSNYKFEMNSDAKSKGNGRFVLLLEKSNTSNVNTQDQTELIVYPNPTNAKVINLLWNGTIDLKQLEIYNSIGEKVNPKSYTTTKTTDAMVINFSNWQSGVYLISAQVGNTVIKKKIIVNQ